MDTAQAASITAILVAYNSEAVIAKALSALDKASHVARIVVVDNASVDNTCDIVSQQFPKVLLIENNTNEGFGRANNLGFKKVETPYALLVNPDAVVCEGCINSLLAAAQLYTDAAILAPQLQDEHGHVHHSYKKSVFDRERSSGEYITPEGDLCADFVSGAVMLLNMKHMRTIGFFDPKIFLYYEDDDICLRARRAGLGVLFIPSAQAIHLMGRSSGEGSKKVEFFKQRHITWSRLYVEEKYHGRKQADKLASKLRWKYAIKAAWYASMVKPARISRYRGRLAGIFDFIDKVQPPTQP